MRRLIALLAAVSLVAGPLATAGGAMSKERRETRAEQRNDHAQRGDQRGNQGNGRYASGPARAAPAPQVYRGAGEYRGDGRYEQADPRTEPRGEYRGESRGDYRGEPRYDPRYDPRSNGPPAGAYSAAPRRGGYLGPGAGAVIQNPASQRLRPAPRGMSGCAPSVGPRWSPSRPARSSTWCRTRAPQPPSLAFSI